ncbi:MAG TPA: pyridoxal phosphate-dependent aminotransferase [Syntrophomonadaceae bacterium]|nr:pyridoxal phosphate-dependent aminotransferase [Syntrophomonadaceae bacterium]HNX92124.1 pyridoxal phosphate-dependent aminotransferase [Syntrophomonas sp.]
MKNNPLPTRTDSISSFIVMDVMEKAQILEAQGHDIIHMEIGEPDFPTPEPVKAAAVESLQKGDTHYTHSLGKIELREEISRYYWNKYQVNVSPDQIIVTSGTSPALLLILSVLVESGQNVILPDPCYACYPNFIKFLGGNPRFVPVYEEDGFKYRPETVAEYIDPQTKAVLVNSPSNPCGTVFSSDNYRALTDLSPFIISDEIYNGLVYEGREHTVLQFTSDAFVINGFSKLYAMTGWRLGYLIAPRQYIRPMQKVQQNLFICAASFAQEGGIAALRECDSHVEEMRKTYDERRRFLLSRLHEMDIATKVDPTGAFYALANIKAYSNDSYSFAFEIMENAGLAVTPGIDFGPNCEGYIRLSYASSIEAIKTGLERLENFLSNYEKR